MNSNEFQSLKITAVPRCGIVTDSFMPIDAILFYAAMRRKYGPQLVTNSSGVPDVAPVELPLAKRGDGDLWYYAASFAEWDCPTEGTAFWNKRFDTAQSDLVDFGRKKGMVIIKKGHYKAYHSQINYRHARSISWYVVGDSAEIKALLDMMRFVGKKTAQGWGEIASWSIEAMDYNWSVWRGSELMRSIPAPSGIVYGIRPSYWLRSNQVPCLLPS